MKASLPYNPDCYFPTFLGGPYAAEDDERLDPFEDDQEDFSDDDDSVYDSEDDELDNIENDGEEDD